MKELKHVSGGWGWKGAVIGAGSGLGGGALGGLGGAAIGLGVGFIGGGLLGKEDEAEFGGASSSW